MMRHITLILSIVLVSGTMWAQNVKVTGKVSDKTGEPLIGVSVILEGTHTGVSTDVGGNYSLQAPSNGVLLFSAIGMESRREAINGRTVINLTLNESSVVLNELVVTALGISREKKALSYSVQEVKADKLLENRGASVMNSLAGKVAGLQISKTSSPGGSTKILLRGVNSLNGNNMPLIVVDGIPYDNRQGTSGDVSWGGTDFGDGISNLNQDDIESISVLKGPSATALYGSRAGNGVVLVTTKKGNTEKGPRISFSSNYTFDELMIQPEYQNEYGQGTLGEFQNNLRASWGPKMDGRILAANNATWKGILSGDPTIMNDWTGKSVPFKYYNNDLKHLLNDGSTWNNSVDVNLGSGKTAVRASVSDSRTKGVVPTNEFSKTGATLRATGEVIKNLTFDTKFSYMYQKGKNRQTLAASGYNPMFGYQYVPRSINLADFFPIIDPATGKSRMFEAGTPTLCLNPYIAMYLKGNTDVTDRLSGFASVKYQFTDWLSLMGRVGVDTYQMEIEGWTAKGNQISTSAINGSFSQDETHFLETNSDFLLVAKKDNLFGSKFSGSISAGGNIMDRKSRELYADATGLNVDGLYTIANGINKSSSNYKSHKQVQSLYGFAQLSYDGWAFMDITGRNDWSSTLPKNNLSFFYPSVGLGIVVSDMLKSYKVSIPNWISFAKIRGSVASAGNDTDPYNLSPVYSTIQNLPGGQTGVILPGTLPNSNLKPEIVTSSELGFELRLFSNRIGVDFTYYQKAAKNQIFNVSTSTTTGYSAKWINAGKVENKGVEVVLNAVPVKTKDLNWNLTFNYAKNNSKVAELDGTNTTYKMWSPGATQIDIKAIVGRPVGEIYSTSRITNENGELILEDNAKSVNYGLPTVSGTKSQYVGNMNPDWTGAISSSLNWKGFYCNFLIDARIGGVIYLNSMVRLNSNGATKETLEGRDSWYPFFEGYIKGAGYNPYTDGPSDTKYKDLIDAATAAEAGIKVTGVGKTSGEEMSIYVNPQHYFGRYGQDHYVYDMTNVRLRELSIGYNFPEKWLERTPIKGLKFSLVGNNLFFFYNNLPGFDPESTYTTGNAQGVETASFASTRSFGFNLNIAF